ncbi:MAG TPA: ABC transporter permease [Anaerolineae bacterium]
MDLIVETVEYALTHQQELWQALIRHLELVGVALAVAIVVCVPLGVWTSRSRAAAATVINTFNTLRVIPSLAVLFLAIPYFGLSFTSAAIALTLLALPPILVNTDTAFRSIDPAIREAATGMGMSRGQILRRVEIPLALPIVLAGIRTAATEVIASATLAAFIGSGGLGRFVVLGFGMFDTAILLAGAVPVALLTLLAEVGLGGLQRLAEPPGVVK